MPRLFVETERMANLNSGMGQMALSLGRELVRQQPPDWQLTFLVPRNLVGIFGPSVEYVIATKWRRIWHPWKFDVWHCLHQGSRYLPARPTQLIYTILDLNYLSLPEYSNHQKARRKRRYQQFINQASAITTISDYVAQDVNRQLVIPPNTPVDVIYCGVDTPSQLPTAPPTLKPGKPFLFFIGMLQPYKNVHTLLPLLEAYPEYQLVLAGPDNRQYSQQIREKAQQMGVSDRLFMPGPVDEPTKWWLYANCEAFLFPSLLEGFGLPVVEAMSFGKPVFCSSLTSLPEVGGREAFYFPSFDAETVVRTFQQGMDAYRRDPFMPDKIQQHRQQFSWEVAAAHFWQLYQDTLLKDSPQSRRTADAA